MTEPTQPVPAEHHFLSAGGELASIIAGYDWSQTSLGPLAAWPPTLKTVVAMILRSPVPIVTLWGADGVMIYNDSYSIFAGGRHPQLLGSKVREGWPEVADFNDNVMKVGLAGGTLAYRDQELVLHRSGVPEPVWMNLDYSPVVDEDGVPLGVIAIVVETTAKVRAEAAVRASEAEFRTLAQAMPNHVWAAPADGRLDWFNHRTYEYTGAAGGQLDGDNWTTMLHPDDVGTATARWAEAVASGRTYETEIRIRRADGVYRWHLARALPIFGDTGAIVRWIGTNTDIEDQKSSAQALEYLNRTLEQQVASRTAERDRMWRLSTDIMLVSDFAGNIVAVNPAATALLGLQEHQIVGHRIVDLVHADDRADTANEIVKISQGVQTLRFENRYLRSDGGYSTLSWTAVPDQHYIHAVGRDITADREAATALKQTELALQQAQKMETIGKLTGGVAHDFNNLLQVISGNLQLLSRDLADNPRAERRVINALAGVNRGAKLASYLLAFGRRQALEPKVVRIGRFVAGMEDMLRRSLGEEIEIETIVSGGLWNTFVDTAQVENALLNLSINARDAMNGIGKLTIEVGNAFLDELYARNHAEVTPGQYVVLAVTDTGSGMTSEVLAQAFEPFFSTKPEGKGTGLGLSMVYGFVKQSGGHVKIYSEIGHGTTVKLYLPRSLESEDLVTAIEPQPLVGGSETILVAEDDEEVRTTVVEMLSELGYSVLKANDAASALTIIESGIRIDMLFTDVVMPGPLRSPDLARKARERLPALAVLFTSGYTENAIVHGGRLDAGVDLLSKPYTREALAQKIRLVLANQKLRGAGVPAPQRHPEEPPRQETGTAPLKILLVEDNDAIRLNTAELLEGLGHAVTAAADAVQALAALERDRVDVLMTDIGLPGMSGEQLAARARALRPKIGVVFATGHDFDSNVPGALLLRKPYDSMSIASALHTIRPHAGSDAGSSENSANSGANGGANDASDKTIHELGNGGG